MKAKETWKERIYWILETIHFQSDIFMKVMLLILLLYSFVKLGISILALRIISWVGFFWVVYPIFKMIFTSFTTDSNKTNKGKR